MPFEIVLKVMKVIKRYTFNYVTKLVPILGKQNSFETFQLFDTWRYQSVVILF